jgi:hypothetical protein
MDWNDLIGMRLPTPIATRIVRSIESQLPPGSSVQYIPPHLLLIGIPPEDPQRGPRREWGVHLGVRRRNGVNPQSTARAVMDVLDQLNRYFSSKGTPSWATPVTPPLIAAAIVEGDAITAIVADSAGRKIVFPSISFEDGEQPNED